MSGYIGNLPVPQATQTRDSFTATEGQTTFSTGGYEPPFVDVFLNGVHLLNGTDYTATDGTDVVLTTGATAGDVIETIGYSAFELFSGTFTGTVTANAFVGDGSGLTGINTDLVSDTTPQLGGNLDLNSNNITGTGGVNITGTVTATSFSGDGSNLTGIQTSPYDTDSTSTGYFDLPSGTTAQRPSTPNTGYVRYNTTESSYEVYDGATWTRLSTAAYPYTFDYIVVAGGGGGGVSISGFETGGGGGAGGYLTGTVNVSPPASYAITIGGGGAGAAGTARSSNGNTSSFGSLTSTVGGGGGAGRTSSPSNYTANSGGSGGGGSGWSNLGGGSGTSGQGNSGGNGTNSDGGTDRNGAGGGGGKGASGGNASGRNGGNGGIGSQWLDGNYYAGGGGGAGGDSGGTGGTGGGGNGRGGTGSGFAATANTGGGGGGGRLGSAGGNGGSGVVIIRYAGGQKGSGGTVTSSGGYTYHTFTTSGTYTA